MSEVYRGGKIPNDLPVSLKKLIEHYDRVLTRNSTSDTINVNYQGVGSTPPAASSAGTVSQLLAFNGVGNVYTLPVEGAGKIRTYRFPRVGLLNFPGNVTFKDRAGNLRLQGDFTPRGPLETITLISDGQLWYEIGRSEAGRPTFVPAALWGATPHATADRSAAIQDALDNVPTGSTLYFEPGTYLCASQLTLTRSNVTVWLDPGAVISSSYNGNAFQLGGSLGAATEALSANASAGAYSITVADTTGFAEGNWIEFEDDATTYGLSNVHRELNRIRDISGAGPYTITLYYPLASPFTTALNAKITLASVVENSHLKGGGSITSPGVTVSEGGNAVRVIYAAWCSVEGLDLYETRYGNIQASNCYGVRLVGNTLRDASLFYSIPTAAGQGYGIITDECVHTVIANNVCFRHRHGIDVSGWSSFVTVTGNTVSGSTQAPIQVHPMCRHVTIVGNTIDGSVGRDNTTGTEFGTTDPGGGIGIREFNNHIIVANNVVRNVQSSGLTLTGAGCSNILVEGNLFENCNQSASGVHAAIRMFIPSSDANATANDCPSAIIRGNVIDTSSRGIVVGFNEIVVEGNILRNITGNAIVVGSGKDTGGGFTGSLTAPVIARNQIFDGSSLGIYVTGSSVGSTAETVYRPVIEGNIIRRCGNDGIRIGSATTTEVTYDAIVRENVCADNSANGISIRDYSDGAIVQENVCTDNATDGINVRGDGTLVFENVCTNTSGTAQDYGVRIPVADASGTILRSNWLTGNNSGPLSDTGTGTVVLQQETSTEVAFNDTGANVDFRVEGDGDANCLVVDASALTNVGAVGIGTATPAQKLTVGGTFGVGVDGSAAYNADFFTTTAGRGFQWRPAASGAPKLLYVGENNKENHVAFSATTSTSATALKLQDNTVTLSQTSGGKSSIVAMGLRIDDDRDITATTGAGLDLVKPFQLVTDRSSSFSNDQGLTLFTYPVNIEMGDQGVYSRLTGSQSTENVFVNMTFGVSGGATFNPTFQATSGSNICYARGVTMTGTVGGNGNAFTALRFSGFEIAHTYLQISGFTGLAGTGGTHYGLYYHPSVSIVSGGAVTEAALRADRSGIFLASDFTSSTDSSGYIRMGGGGDAEIGYNGTNLIIDPDLVGTGRVLIGVTGDDDMLLNTIEIDGDINHDGSNIGFFSVAPIARVGAYTQTYATASKTHAALTSATLTDSTGGTANTTVAQVTNAGGDATTNATINDNFADLTAQVNALRADLENTKQVLNAIVDDLQAYGLFQ